MTIRRPVPPYSEGVGVGCCLQRAATSTPTKQGANGRLNRQRGTKCSDSVHHWFPTPTKQGGNARPRRERHPTHPTSGCNPYETREH